MTVNRIAQGMEGVYTDMEECGKAAEHAGGERCHTITGKRIVESLSRYEFGRK